MFRILLKIFVIVYLILVINNSFAQQIELGSQYVVNYYLINPAVAGTEDFIEFKSGYQRRYADTLNSSRGYYLSGFTILKSLNTSKRIPPHHAIGGVAYSQRVELSVRNSFYLSYAFYIPLSRIVKLSIGALAGVDQYVRTKQSKLDIGVGTWLYSNRYFVGISSMRLLQKQTEYFNSKQDFVRQFYLIGGYRYKLNSNLTLIPSILLKGNTTLSFIDFNSRLNIKNLLWIGAGYRSTRAISLLAGGTIFLRNIISYKSVRNNSAIEFGYSYTAPVSGFGNYSYGNHEITLGLKIPTNVCRFPTPAEFW